MVSVLGFRVFDSGVSGSGFFFEGSAKVGFWKAWPSLWSSGPVVPWFSGPVVLWSPGFWSRGLWSIGSSRSSLGPWLPGSIWSPVCCRCRGIAHGVAWLISCLLSTCFCACLAMVVAVRRVVAAVVVVV